MSRPRARLVIPLVALLAGVGLLFAARPLAFLVLNGLIAREVPGVRRISTAGLAAWLADPSRPRPLLLDVRTPQEFAVSHLAGARRIDPGGGDLAALQGVPRDTPMVTYCSIGYRSGHLAERLRGLGFSRVENLAGSLFAWANEGRPLSAGEGPAERPAGRVHPYDRRWGLLLAKEVRADLS